MDVIRLDVVLGHPIEEVEGLFAYVKECGFTTLPTFSNWVENLRKGHRRLQQEKWGFVNRIEELERENKSYLDQRDMYRQLRDDLEQEKRDLTKKVEELEEAIPRFWRDLNQLQEENELLKKEKQEEEEENLKKLFAYMRELAAPDIPAFIQVLQMRSDTIERLLEKVRELSQEKQGLQERVDRLVKEKDRLYREKDRMKELVCKLDNQIRCAAGHNTWTKGYINDAIDLLNDYKGESK